MNLGQAVKERILELCREQNISVNKLCTMSGVTQSTVNNIINNRNNSTTIATIKKLCDGLNITVEEFFLQRFSVIWIRKFNRELSNTSQSAPPPAPLKGAFLFCTPPMPPRKRLWSFAGLSFRLFTERWVRRYIDGVIVVINHHAGFGAGWLFDIPDCGAVHRDILTLPRLGVIGGQHGSLGDGTVGGLLSSTGDDDMAAVDLLSVQPQVPAVGHAKRQLIVLTVIPAHIDGKSI